MGAWIETKSQVLKFGTVTVAPLVGAWIETKSHVLKFGTVTVAPLVGAWIETDIGLITRILNKSRPSWARGLKRSMVTEIEDSI